jgi:hypothetical protein
MTKTRKQIISDIAGLASAVFDNGRRGGPRPGCDCEQCFGYCLVDHEKAMRDGSERGLTHLGAGLADTRPLDFN